MAELPSGNKISNGTVQAINDLYASKNAGHRSYLGGSEIGHACNRKLWLSFRWAFTEKFEGRMLRLFEHGDIEEKRVIKNLRDAGFTVIDVDPENGKQFRYSDFNGHFSGGIDGKIFGVPDAPKTWHLLEIKTHNDKSFADLKKNGVRKSKPMHYAQMQIYMRWASLTRALYVAVNKNTDEIYAERIDHNTQESRALLDRGGRIISSPEAPLKISEDASYWECKFCPARKLCHDNKVADVNCRTCVHSTPVTDGNGGGQWFCEKHKIEIPEEYQRKGCESHLHLPFLIPFAKPIDSGDGWVKYRMEDGREFIACAMDGFPADSVRDHYSSEEIAEINPNAIGNITVNDAREILGGKIVG